MRPDSPVATDLGAIFADLEEVSVRVRAAAEADLEAPESAGRPTGAGVQLGQAAREARAEVLINGARGLEKLAQDTDPDLSPEEQFGVEAIVLREGRPALFVEGGDFPTTCRRSGPCSRTSARRSATRWRGSAASRSTATPTSTGSAPASWWRPTS